MANPTVAEQKTSKLNIVVAGTEKGIVMVESGPSKFPKKKWRKRWNLATSRSRRSSRAIKELHGQIKPTKIEIAPFPFDQAIYDSMKKTYGARLKDALNTEKHPKKESYQSGGRAAGRNPEGRSGRRRRETGADEAGLRTLREDFFREEVIKAKRRPDGRAFDQIRKITCEVGLLPRVHGSALFTRGETQALATLTLGTKEDMQRLDLLFEQDTFKRFMLHYNFPPFQRGRSETTARSGSTGNRAWRAGGTCAGEPTAAGSGIPVRHARGQRHSGVERIVVDGHGLRRFTGVDGCGRADEGTVRRHRDGVGGGRDGKYSILTDIAGAEDHYGDMDFKVAGTRDGITALQMDIKVTSISIDMMREALAQAKKARLEILDIMEKTLSCAPRDHFGVRAAFVQIEHPYG